VTEQQRQIEALLSRNGWRVVARERFATDRWLDEMWTIESEWTPAGQRAFVLFLVAPDSAERYRPPGRDVKMVAVTRTPPELNTRHWGPEVYLRPRWETNGLPALASMIEGLRDDGDHEGG
jgi:hypothetical protein